MHLRILRDFEISEKKILLYFTWIADRNHKARKNVLTNYSNQC